MTAAQMLERVKAGERLGGLVVNHRHLMEPQQVKAAVLGTDRESLRRMCSRLDLVLMYYTLTGKEYTGSDSKLSLLSKLRDIAREM